MTEIEQLADTACAWGCHTEQHAKDVAALADSACQIAASLADAQAEIARLRGALEAVRLNAENRDSVWSLASEALKK